MKALTVKRIEKLKPSKNKKGKLVGSRHRDPESKGLYIQVSPTGTKCWLLRYELNHKERFMGLGEYPLFSLKQARERAQAARRLLADGTDPIDARDSEKQARAEQAHKAAGIPTFKEAAERYFRVHGDKWRNDKHRKQFFSTLEAYAYPKLGNLRVNEIKTDDVRQAIEPVWRTIPATASRTRGRIENVLSWAIANRFRESPNPARWADNLEHLLPAIGLIAKKDNHHAALPYAALQEFWAALNERDGTAARALEFTILTAARSGEVTGAVWDELDLKSKTWTVPANRIKGGKEHRVPLSDGAVEILESLPKERGNHFVFVGPNKGGLSGTAMFALLARMGRTDVTVHGFRSTFRDWAAERTATPNHIVEMALAHTVGNAVERAYRRTDLFEKRRKLMADWAKFCITPLATGTVVPIRKAQ